jgi:hypothetical protein
MLRRAALACLLLVLVRAASVSAAITEFSYTIDPSDPSVEYGYQASGPCAIDNLNTTHYYQVQPFYVTETGVYSIFEVSLSQGHIAVYTAPFDPANPLDNCYLAADCCWDMALTADTQYYMVQTTYGWDIFGTFTFRADGPGGLEFGNLSEPSEDSTGPVIGAPCGNLFDGRINDNQSLDCAAPVALYILDGRVNVYAINPNTGRGTLVISSSGAVDDAESEPSGNILLGSSGSIRLYWLPATQEYLLQATYADGKPYEVVWSDDGSNVRHTAA